MNLEEHNRYGVLCFSSGETYGLVIYDFVEGKSKFVLPSFTPSLTHYSVICIPPFLYVLGVVNMSTHAVVS